jgi:hypothetical protein
MKSKDYHFNLENFPLFAERLLDNYKRDRLYFENYSSRFNHEFLVRFEERVNSLARHTPLQILENGIIQINNKIETIIYSFIPLLNITETFLRRVPGITGIRISNFSINEVREALDKRSVGEIQKSCHKIIRELELHLDEFLDKGFMLILLGDFNLLIKKLNQLEFELADISHRRNMIADEFLFADRQLKEFLDTIIESTPAVFGVNETDKIEEYSLEKLMMHAQFKRTECQ